MFWDRTNACHGQSQKTDEVAELWTYPKAAKPVGGLFRSYLRSISNYYSMKY